MVRHAFLPCARNVAFYQPHLLLDMVCVACSLGASSCTRSAHGGCGSFITQKFSHEIQSADHMMDAQRDDGEGDEPTLVMGASIVMEWIRAIEECLRWELPGRMKKEIPIL